MDSELAVLFLRHKVSAEEQKKLVAAGVESLSTLANLEADDLKGLGIPFLKAKALIKDAAVPARSIAAAVPMQQVWDSQMCFGPTNSLFSAARQSQPQY